MPSQFNETTLEKIEETKTKLIPLFGISDEELKKFQSPIIFRDYEFKDYPERGGLLFWEQQKTQPGYDALRNLFYFPTSDTKDKMCLFSSFSEYNFVRVVSEYLHHQINPELIQYSLLLRLKKINKETDIYDRLRKAVAIYPNIIFGNLKIENREHSRAYTKEFHLFIDEGPDFLPKLSRMSLEEVLEKGLLN